MPAHFIIIRKGKMITVKLAIINQKENIKSPYWFTRDKSIYLNPNNDSQEIDEASLSIENVIQIINGTKKGIIECSGIVELTKIYEQQTKQKLDTVRAAVKAPLKSRKELLLDKMKEFEKKAKELVELPVAKLKTEIGQTSLTENGELQQGISDVDLLKLIIDAEKSNKNRKTVIDICSDRMKAIENSNGFMVEEDQEIKITQQDFHGKI